MVAFAGYPLLVEGRQVGVLAMFGRKQLGQGTLESLEVVADVVAQGIEGSRNASTFAQLCVHRDKTSDRFLQNPRQFWRARALAAKNFPA